MSLGVVKDLRSPRSLDTAEDAAAYQEHLLAEYVFARAARHLPDRCPWRDPKARRAIKHSRQRPPLAVAS